MCAETGSHNAFQLAKYITPDIPPTAYYIPDFITDNQEQELINNIYSVPKPKWTTLSGRRLQNWGGHPHPKGMVPEPMPKWLTRHIELVTSSGLFGDKTPNYVLINEYEPAQGIMPHTDGPLYTPTVVNVSLCSPIVMDFYRNITDKEADASLEKRYAFSFLLERRSLLCLKGEMYEGMLHGIEGRHVDRVPCGNVKNVVLDTPLDLARKKRVSLTLRHVEKVLQVKLRLSK